MKKIQSLLLLAACSISSAQAQVSAVAQFNSWTEYPLVKKIGVYQTPITTRECIVRDNPKLAEIEARAMRYEIAWGKQWLYALPCITGTKENPVYDFKALDFFFDHCADHTPAFVFSHGYTPEIIQQNNDFMLPPTDYDVWKEINRTFAQHWREKGYSNRYVEVWNEPDLYDGFFRGTVDDYLKIYQYAAPGAKDGDPDCKVGGPAGAFNWWHQNLIDKVKNENLPLDFLSGHAYGPDYLWQLDGMRNALNTYNNKEAEMLLTEYAAYVPADYAADGKVERAEAAMTFFNALPKMLEYTDLTYVTWAQWIDPTAFVVDKLGLIDKNDGSRKSLFNAFKLYGMMPADRRLITVGSPLQGMASGNDECVAAVVWNPTTTPQSLNLTLRGIPFDEGTIEIYHIDEQTNSWYELRNDSLNPDRKEDITINNNVVTLKDVVRSQGVYFVRIQTKDAQPLFPCNEFAKIIKTHNYYPVRTNDAPYAQFDSKTWTAYLSMNNSDAGRAVVGVVAEDVPDEFQVISYNSGNLTGQGKNATVNVRVDYQSADGSYTKSTIFAGRFHRTTRTTGLPWGTKRQADEVVKVDRFNDFTINLKEHQPADFSGRVIISFDMEQMSKNSKVNIQLRPLHTPLFTEPRVVSTMDGTIAEVAFDGDMTDIEEAGFIYLQNADPKSSGKKVDAEVKDGKFVATISGLTAMTDYHIRGWMKTKDGVTHLTEEAVFVASVQKPDVTTISPSVFVNRLVARLRGQISSDNGSKITRSGFVWCEGTDHEPQIDTDQVIDVTTSNTDGTFTEKLEGLKPDTDYSYRAFAQNAVGLKYGDTVIFSTKDETNSIAGVSTECHSRVKSVHTLDGRSVEKPQRGINIIRFDDGKTEIVFVK